MKFNFKKGFTFSEMIIVMSIIMMTMYIWRDVFAQKSMEMYLKDEADKVKFLVYEHILNTNVGYVSGASSSCGNLSFDKISPYRISQCVGNISERFFKLNDSTGCANPGNQNIGLCSFFSSERVIPFRVYIDEDSANTDTLYLYITIDPTSTIDDKDKLLFEQSLYGYLANAFSPILLAEHANVYWDGTSPQTTNIKTSITGINFDRDGSFMLELKKI